MAQDKNEGHKDFTQCPNSIMDGYPELAIYDKWVLLTLMRVCWKRGPHKLSLREISSLSGVPSSLLCSTSPGAKKPKEGILDRLERLGLIKVESCKPVNPITGVKGRVQTYICIEHEKIWSHNDEFFTSNKSIEPNMYLAKDGEYETVRQTNSDSPSDTVDNVRQENNNDRVTNDNVRVTNNKDRQTNNNVRTASSNVTPNTVKIKNTLEDNKDNVPIGTANETAELNDQEIIDANSTPLTSSTRPSDTNTDGIHDTHPNGSDKPTSPNVGTSPNEGKVEPTLRTNGAVLPIARVTTRKRKSKDKTDKTEQPLQTPLPELIKQEPTLSDKAREVWNIWLKMPWNKIEPKLTETAAKHCEDLSKVDLTEEILWQVITYARKNDKNKFYNGRAIQLGDIVREYPKWSNAQHTQASQSKPSSASAYTLDEIKAIRRMTPEQRKDFNQKRRDSVNAVAASSSYVSSYA